MRLISRCLPDPQAFKGIRVPFFIKAELKSADKNRTVEGIVYVSQVVLKKVSFVILPPLQQKVPASESKPPWRFCGRQRSLQEGGEPTAVSPHTLILFLKLSRKPTRLSPPSCQIKPHKASVRQRLCCWDHPRAS